jgi:hypothetical protein
MVYLFTFYLHVKVAAHKPRAPDCPGGQHLYGDAYHLWVVVLKLALYHPPGTYNFEVVPRFVEKSVGPCARIHDHLLL